MVRGDQSPPPEEFNIEPVFVLGSYTAVLPGPPRRNRSPKTTVDQNPSLGRLRRALELAEGLDRGEYKSSHYKAVTELIELLGEALRVADRKAHLVRKLRSALQAKGRRLQRLDLNHSQRPSCPRCGTARYAGQTSSMETPMSTDRPAPVVHVSGPHGCDLTTVAHIIAEALVEHRIKVEMDPADQVPPSYSGQKARAALADRTVKVVVVQLNKPAVPPTGQVESCSTPPGEVRRPDGDPLRAAMAQAPTLAEVLERRDEDVGLGSAGAPELPAYHSFRAGEGGRLWRHHGCERCVYLGSLPAAQADLYFCDSSGSPAGTLTSVLARFGDDVQAFHTAKVNPDGIVPEPRLRNSVMVHALNEAHAMAKKKGLVP